MNGMSNDYIAMKLWEARDREIRRESEQDRLASIALRDIRAEIMRRLPKVRISHN